MTDRSRVTVVLNGRPCELPVGATVDAAVDAAGAAPSWDGIAVAVDGEVLRRRDWQATALADGQRVEIVQAVQGG